MESMNEIPASSTYEERICLNIGGHKFETYQVTLASVPGTQISTLSKTDPTYSEEKEEYFFDRNPCLFPFILEAYHGREVNFPGFVQASTIRSELLFWGLGEDKLSAESAKKCKEWDDGKKLVEQLSRAVNDHGSASMHSLWVMLEYPSSSWKAMIWYVVYTILVMITVLVISCMTLPVFKHYIMEMETGSSRMGIEERNKISEDSEMKKMIGIYFFCALVFLIDLIARFIMCPSKIEFFKSFFNIIDIVGIFPMVVVAMIDVCLPRSWNMVIRSAIFAAISILRALRLFKIVRQSRHLYVLVLAAKASLREYLFLFLATFIGMIIFSTIIFYVEMKTAYTHFTSIPHVFWYTIVSMTTVGYGDMIPVTFAGKIIGGIGIAYGLALAMITIPVFIFNYMKYRALVDLKIGVPPLNKHQTPQNVV